MRAILQLTREHEAFRRKLGMLKAALAVGESAWFVVREVCCSLDRQLRAHRRHEAELRRRCGGLGGLKALVQAKRSHAAEQRALRAVNRFLMERPQRPLRTVRPTVEALTASWLGHMNEQEAHLFPIVEVLLALDQLTDEAEEPAGRFTQAMTVDHVVRQHPRTRPVFERLFVNIRGEGYDPLDEVAGRHGMSPEALVDLLEKEAALTG